MEVMAHLDYMGYSGYIVPEINATSGGETIQLLKNYTFKNFHLHQRNGSIDSTT